MLPVLGMSCQPPQALLAYPRNLIILTLPRAASAPQVQQSPHPRPQPDLPFLEDVSQNLGGGSSARPKSLL